MTADHQIAAERVRTEREHLRRQRRDAVARNVDLRQLNHKTETKQLIEMSGWKAQFEATLTVIP